MGILSGMVAVMLAQAAASMVTVEAHARPDVAADPRNVGYAELVAGRPADAIAKIRGNRSLSFDDPAALINLGSAHARLGHREKATRLYKAAVLSRTRYDLQLAGGRWMDSRSAAQLALAGLTRGEALVAVR